MYKSNNPLKQLLCLFFVSSSRSKRALNSNTVMCLWFVINMVDNHLIVYLSLSDFSIALAIKLYNIILLLTFPCFLMKNLLLLMGKSIAHQNPLRVGCMYMLVITWWFICITWMCPCLELGQSEVKAVCLSYSCFGGSLMFKYVNEIIL